ncbi:MAG: ribonuclease H-like domain-containing protein [Myxococcota bacterium]
MKTRFGRQLSRLRGVGAGGRVSSTVSSRAASPLPVPVEPETSGSLPVEGGEPSEIRSELEARIARIRAQLESMTARRSRSGDDGSGDGGDTRGVGCGGEDCTAAVGVAGDGPPDSRLTEAPGRQLDGSELAGVLLGETVQTPSGRMHRVVKRYRKSHAQGCGPVSSALDASPQAIASIALDPAVAEVCLRRALYFDTETTGLAGGTGTLPFLVGTAAFDEDQTLVVEQLVLRRPGEERPMLERFAERLAAASCVVSYNGKSFDWPLLRTRFVMNRMTPPELPVHIDLLHCARRVFKARLGEGGHGVSLAAVESEVFGMGRVDDVAGGKIPECYAAFLRGEAGAVLNPVIEHNAHDLVSLASLLGDLSMRYLRDPTVVCAIDSLGLAKTALRAKDLDAAGELARAASQGDRSVAVEAAIVEARVAQQRLEFSRAADAFRRALTLGDGEQPEVHLALAKLYEHKLKDLEAALRHAMQLGEEEEKRRERLRRRIERVAQTGRRRNKARAGVAELLLA